MAVRFQIFKFSFDEIIHKDVRVFLSIHQTTTCSKLLNVNTQQVFEKSVWVTYELRRKCLCNIDD